MEKLDINNIAMSIDPQYGVLYYVPSLENSSKNYMILRCHQSYNRVIEKDGKKYLDDRFITIDTEKEVCEALPKSELYNVIKDAIVFITSRARLVDIPANDEILNEYLNTINNSEFVNEIYSFGYDGEIPLDDVTMQKLCIEKPIRKAVLELTNHGINTIMSSANSENVEKKNEPVDESKIYIGQDDPWVIGNGYAWLMFDWDELSEENRQFFRQIHNGGFDLKLSDKELSDLKHNCEINQKEFNQKELVKLYEYVDVDREEAEKYSYDSQEIVDKLEYLSPLSTDHFYEENRIYLVGHNSLNNHNDKGHFRTAVIRYPVSEQTKVEDVERFYDTICKEMIKNNKQTLNAPGIN